jgi:hypothetical protein
MACTLTHCMGAKMGAGTHECMHEKLGAQDWVKNKWRHARLHDKHEHS